MATRLCPVCGTTLATSKAGNVYCPKGAWMKKPGNTCTWKGESKWKSYAASPKIEKSAIPPLKTPSEEQTTIFSRFVKSASHLLLNALAGTGKTTVLIQLIRLAVGQGLTVLCLCFARRDKLALEAKACGNGKIGTSNGAGHWILSDYLRRTGKGKLELAGYQAKNLLETRWKEDGHIVMVKGEPDWKIKYAVFATIVSLVDKVRQVIPMTATGKKEPTEKDWEDVAARFGEELPQEDRGTILFYAAWLFTQIASLRLLEATGETDYTNQVFLPVYHGLMPTTTYDVVLVDEGQDQNPYNRTLATLYLKPGGKLVVVGDENQAIYEWRGADEDSMGEWRGIMGECESYPLTLCRRCSQTVIEDAQKIVSNIRALPNAPVGSRRNIATTAELVEELATKKKGLVICRTNAPLVSLVLKLMARGVAATLMRTNLIGDLLRLIDTASERNDNLPIPALLQAVNVWAQERIAKLAKQRNGEGKIAIVKDKVDVLEAFSLQATIKTAGQLKREIDRVFPPMKDGEKPDPDKLVVGSTVHGMKGGEATTNYLYSPEDMKVSLWDTIWGSERERDNVLYVAITRTMLDIIYCGKAPTLRRFSEAGDGDDETGDDE